MPVTISVTSAQEEKRYADKISLIGLSTLLYLLPTSIECSHLTSSTLRPQGNIVNPLRHCKKIIQNKQCDHEVSQVHVT